MAAAERWTRTERVAAAITLVNAGLGLLMSIFSGNAGTDPLLLSLPGLLSGVLAWRGRRVGHALGLAFYALQFAGYHPYHSTDAYPLRGALSVAAVVHLPAGVLIVNLFAVAMFAASAALLWRRLRTSPAALHNTYQ